MNDINWIEIIILTIVLVFCLRYAYRSAKNLFAPKEQGGGCGGCSSANSCSTEAKATKMSSENH
jgi:hypothetical protein